MAEIDVYVRKGHAIQAVDYTEFYAGIIIVKLANGHESVSLNFEPEDFDMIADLRTAVEDAWHIAINHKSQQYERHT